MKFDRIEMRIVPLQLRERFEISSGGRKERLIFIVTIHDGDRTGWGECVVGEDPGYSYETTDTAWHILKDFLIPRVIGGEFADPGAVAEQMAWVRGHPMAQAALEMAAWDLHSRQQGLPLALAIGGDRRPVDVGVSIGLQPDVETLLQKVEGYLNEGYGRIKIKIKPGRDLEMLTEVRAAFPEARILADANSAYTLNDLPLLKRMDALNLMMIEQPFAWDDFADHAKLQASIDTPVCLDESITSPRAAKLALEMRACGVINIKPGRVGGIGNAIQIHDLCHDAGMPAWCGGMLESGIGRAFNVALATLPGFTLPGDISGSRRYWERDLVTPEWVIDDGTLTPHEGLGIGVTPDVERIHNEATRVHAAEAR